MKKVYVKYLYFEIIFLLKLITTRNRRSKKEKLERKMWKYCIKEPAYSTKSLHTCGSIYDWCILNRQNKFK